MKRLIKQIRRGGFCLATFIFSTSTLAHELQFEEPYAACEASSRSDACAFTNGEGDLHRGTCQNFAETLMCVRNQPIVYAAATDLSLDSHTHEHESDHSHD